MSEALLMFLIAAVCFLGASMERHLRAILFALRALIEQGGDDEDIE